MSYAAYLLHFSMQCDTIILELCLLKEVAYDRYKSTGAP